MTETKQVRKPKFWAACIPVAAILAFMLLGTLVWAWTHMFH